MKMLFVVFPFMLILVISSLITLTVLCGLLKENTVMFLLVSFDKGFVATYLALLDLSYCRKEEIMGDCIELEAQYNQLSVEQNMISDLQAHMPE